jgi:hypothetical protein
MKRFHGRSAAAAAFFLATTLGASSHASQYVGDLVYCDVDSNGRFDGSDYKLNGVEVHVTCHDLNGTTCFDGATTTGALDETVTPSNFDQVCGAVAGYSAAGDLSGRYLVEILGVNGAAPGCLVPTAGQAPYLCTVTVNEATLPSTCNGLVTPVVGLPADGNADGDWCDPEDGPFPEGQILGDSSSSQAACQLRPSPGPSDGVHRTITSGSNSTCSLYADFGYTPRPVSGPTRTPGFWKNHPDALAQFLPVSYCGRAVTQVCDAAGLLGQQGGGLNAFARHATAAQLNCEAFGCSADVAEVIAEGDAACAAHTDYDFGAAASLLDEFNNSGDALAATFEFGAANPKFCSAPAKRR